LAPDYLLRWFVAKLRGPVGREIQFGE
jgi:hypothetical protein